MNMAHTGVMYRDGEIGLTASGIFADETNKMEDMYESGPDLLSDRALFQAIVEEAYSTSSSTMQLDQCLSSQGTSSPGFNTPSSSNDLQEEGHSPNINDDFQDFNQGVLATDMFAYMRGTSPRPPDVEMSEVGELDLNNQQPFEDEFISVTPNTQTYLLQYRQSPVPLYVRGDHPQDTSGYGLSTNQDYNAWSDLDSELSNEPAFTFETSRQHLYHIPRFVPPDQQTLLQIPTSRSTLDQSSTSPQTSIPSTVPTFCPDAYRGGHRESFAEDVSLNHNHPWTSVNHGHQTNEVSDAGYPTAPLKGTNQQTIYRPSLQPAPAQMPRQMPIQEVPFSPESSPSPRERERERDTKRGGRKNALPLDKREEINRMRKTGSCWICAFQRDKCDEGFPCSRCTIRSQRGQTHLLPCVRTHLQDLVASFLPLTMIGQHRQADTISFVKDNVRSWNVGPEIQVHLTSEGLGDFSWDLHEFEPSNDHILYQRRYILNSSGDWQPVDKRSPPLAVKLVNYSHMEKLESYVDSIIDRYLTRFQEDCYSDEEVGATFQTDLLKALCSLFINLPGKETDKNLKGDVRQVIKMLVITYIMDHALTIVDEVQHSVISRMQRYNNPSWYAEWTSPFLANRQLKYFFSIIRNQQYERVLNRLHQILRTAQDKSRRWLSSFVLMLGIALVLEQCQHMLWIKAENRISRDRCAAYDAKCEARKCCIEIDSAFDFLCKLYHCKYRGKHRQKTRFSEWSSQTSDPAEKTFVKDISDIVDRDGGYLLQRSELSISNEKEKNYTSRLVSKFLVDLMGLDRSSP